MPGWKVFDSMDLDDEFDATRYLKLLVEDLEPLAALADAQARWVTEKHLPLEELWLQLDDDILGVPHAVKEGAMSPAAAAAVDALYAHMESMTKVHFASFGALDDPVWQTVRELAADALEKIRHTSSREQRGSG
jgi:hypothetical protein